MKCPKCGSTNVQGTNVGQRIFAGVCAGVGGLISAPFTRTPGGTGKTIYKEVCPNRTYICLACKHDFIDNTHL